MERNGSYAAFARGQRMDLYITALRDKAEDAFGGAFADAAALSARIDDPQFIEEEFDTAAIGLICSAVLKARPLPRFLRKGLGLFLQVTPEERADPMTIPVHGKQSSVQARTDRAALDFVIDCLRDNLYSRQIVAGPFTDLACGLSGLGLTWRRDILAEADADGIISTRGLKRIQAKLSAATIHPAGAATPILIDHAGKTVPAINQSAAVKETERRLHLIEIVERAISVGSSIQCVPSSVREKGISESYQRFGGSAERSA